jgi:prepilin-type N-terminal cleavage/methylation domain-containing protein
VKTRAFSLIELVIALAIIAVLISILLPALLHARTASQTTVCAANQRQLASAFQVYLQEHRRFPAAESTPEWRYAGVEFRGVPPIALLAADRPLNACYSDRLPSDAGEYIASFRCPGDRGLWRAGPSPRLPGPSVTGGRTCFEFYGNSYRANQLLMDSTAAGIDGLHRPLAEHEITVSPARLLVAGDAEWYYATRPPESPDAAFDASWHADFRGGNMAAFDGSVRYVLFSPSAQPAFTLAPRPTPGAPN